MEARHRQFNIVTGVRRAGKSTFLAEKVVKPYTGGNVMVVKHTVNREDPAFDFLPEKTMSNWRQGAKPGTPVKFKVIIDVDQYRDLLKWVVAENFKNGLLIVDDCTIFEAGGKLTKEMALLATMCRHIGLDLWLVYHGLTKLPIEQFIFVDYFIIFNTTDSIARKKNIIPEYERFRNAIIRARLNYISADPRIKYTPVILKLA